MIADILGDVQVYAASEMRKYGLDNDRVLQIIMKSNFSKNNPDGTTSYDEEGKVLKGPNYKKPEPEIYEYIRSEREKARIALTPLTVTTLVQELSAQRAYTLDGVTNVEVATLEPDDTAVTPAL
jgi:hypothetical protein